jgi:hypothetical protein
MNLRPTLFRDYSASVVSSLFLHNAATTPSSIIMMVMVV